MNRLKLILSFAVLNLSLTSMASNWKSQWICSGEQQNATNTWTVYHKSFQVNEIPDQALAKIACDSKYWMWINGELAVFEGQLKRVPFKR